MKFIVSLICCLLLLNACSSDIDLEQTKTISASPIYTTNFINYDKKATHFSTIPNEQQLIDTSAIEMFKTGITRIDLNFEIQNTFSRDFEIRARLTDINYTTLASFVIEVPAHSGPTVLTHLHEEVFENERLSALLNSKMIITRSILKHGETINHLDLNEISVRSSATFYFQVR
jgi:hypothetical protein